MSTVVLLFVCLSLCAAPVLSQTTPWSIGDETTMACFKNPPLGSTANPTPVVITGIKFGFVNPIPTLITAGVPINSSMQLNLDATFYTNNTGVFLPDPSSTTFNQLCLQRINPQNTLQSACLPPISADTCCIPHVNWHFCSMVYFTSPCMPWVQPVNNSAGYVLVTDSPAQYGFPSSQWNSGSFAVQQADKYTILGHFKMGNIQCAVGAIRNVLAASSAPVPLPTETASTPTPAPTDSTSLVSMPAFIGGITAAAVVTVAALGAFTCLLLRRRSGRQQLFSGGSGTVSQYTPSYQGPPPATPRSPTLLSSGLDPNPRLGFPDNASEMSTQHRQPILLSHPQTGEPMVAMPYQPYMGPVYYAHSQSVRHSQSPSDAQSSVWGGEGDASRERSVVADDDVQKPNEQEIYKNHGSLKEHAP